MMSNTKNQILWKNVHQVYGDEATDMVIYFGGEVVTLLIMNVACRRAYDQKDAGNLDW